MAYRMTEKPVTLKKLRELGGHFCCLKPLPIIQEVLTCFNCTIYA